MVSKKKIESEICLLETNFSGGTEGLC